MEVYHANRRRCCRHCHHRSARSSECVAFRATGRIQEGVNLVTSGGLLDIAAGTYTDNVNINKPVEIAGASQATVTVQPSFIGANTGGGSLASGSSNVLLVQAVPAIAALVALAAG